MDTSSSGYSRAIARMLSLLAATAVAVAAFLDWLAGGVRPTRVPVRDLYYGISDTTTGFWRSMALPLLAAAVLALLATLSGSRTVAWLSFLVALATTALWTVLTAVHRSDRNLEFTSRQWHIGYWLVLVGLLLGLIAAVIPWRRAGTYRDEPANAWPPTNAARAA
jgi:hypothetical protein